MAETKKSKIKKRVCGFLITSIILVLLYVFYSQYRYFYKVGDITFTFWKTYKGCYIMPYKYFGITIPKNDYMRAPNLEGVVIFVGDDLMLYVFHTFTAYGTGPHIIEINLSSFKYKYFPYSDSGREEVDLMNYYKNKEYPYIDIYIGEMRRANVVDSIKALGDVKMTDTFFKVYN